MEYVRIILDFDRRVLNAALDTVRRLATAAARRQAREQSAYLAIHGGQITDASEREIFRRVAGGAG